MATASAIMTRYLLTVKSQSVIVRFSPFVPLLLGTTLAPLPFGSLHFE